MMAYGRALRSSFLMPLYQGRENIRFWISSAHRGHNQATTPTLVTASMGLTQI